MALITGVIVIAFENNMTITGIASLIGAAFGILSATLDHNGLTMKAEAMRNMNSHQWFYLLLRLSMGTALGVGAAFVAHSALTSAQMLAHTDQFIAFGAAYLFDASKLSPAK